MFKNKLSVKMFFDFIHSNFFKVIGISLLFGFALAYLIYISDTRGWVLGVIIIAGISLIFRPDAGDVEDGSLLHENNKFGSTIVITVLTILVAEVLLFQSLIFNFRTVNTNVVVTKQIVSPAKKSVISSNTSKIDIEILNQLQSIVKHLAKNDAYNATTDVVKQERKFLYTVQIYNANNNKVIDTYTNLDYNHSLVYAKIESVTFFKKYVPFLDFYDSYKYNYATPDSEG